MNPAKSNTEPPKSITIEFEYPQVPSEKLMEAWRGYAEEAFRPTVSEFLNYWNKYREEHVPSTDQKSSGASLFRGSKIHHLRKGCLIRLGVQDSIVLARPDKKLFRSARQARTFLKKLRTYNLEVCFDF